MHTSADALAKAAIVQITPVQKKSRKKYTRQDIQHSGGFTMEKPP